MKADQNKYDDAQQLALRAEAFCAALHDNGIYFDDLVVEFAGSFRRAYRSDIDKVISEDGKITLVLNRDGFYDKLPQGLFHQPLGSSRTAVLKDMVAEHRRYKAEERAARKFFQPIQQEIFRYAVMAEQEERDILFSTLNGQVPDAFFHFWDIAPDLPREPAEALIRLMPLQKRIKGDKQLIAKSLELCLTRKVTVAEKTVQQQPSHCSFFTSGEGLLGVDTIAGDMYTEMSKWWTFIIHDLSVDEISQFRETEPMGKFLSRFKEIFIPIEIDARFEYHQTTSTKSENEYIMGYGFYL